MNVVLLIYVAVVRRRQYKDGMAIVAEKNEEKSEEK